MSYYSHTTLKGKSFDEAISIVSEALKEEGFGILSDINLSAAFKNKLNKDFRKYTILGACNPGYAYKVLQEEDKMGVFLPCNVEVEEKKPEEIEITIIDPLAAILAVNNTQVELYAAEVKEKLQRVIEGLH